MATFLPILTPGIAETPMPIVRAFRNVHQAGDAIAPYLLDDLGHCPAMATGSAYHHL
mgnify:CR=1 FL=1